MQWRASANMMPIRWYFSFRTKNNCFDVVRCERKFRQEVKLVRALTQICTCAQSDRLFVANLLHQFQNAAATCLKRERVWSLRLHAMKWIIWHTHTHERKTNIRVWICVHSNSERARQVTAEATISVALKPTCVTIWKARPIFALRVLCTIKTCAICPHETSARVQIDFMSTRGRACAPS